jgi:hypothetical protein
VFAILYFATAALLVFAVLRLGCGPCATGQVSEVGPENVMAPPRIPVVKLGWALSIFLAVTYMLCVGFDLIFPQYAMYRAWISLMPGMTWLTATSFLIGLAEAFAYGWFVALVFGPISNVIAARG